LRSQFVLNYANVGNFTATEEVIDIAFRRVKGQIAKMAV